MDHAPSCPPGGPRRAMQTCSGQSGWSQRVSGAARPPRRPHELLCGRATSCAATRTLATDLLSRAAGTADWPLATRRRHGTSARDAWWARQHGPADKDLHRWLTNPTAPNSVKSAPRGAAREMWHRGSGAHMRSRGRNAATAAGGAWVGPNWWRSAVELRSFARRDHLVVALAARRRAGHAPLSQGGCPRWALLEVAPRCGVGGCCGSAARATEARAPQPNPFGGPPESASFLWFNFRVRAKI